MTELAEAVRFLLPAFTACVLLSGIHGYLGYHVITRGVIFVDLSLAQIAALGGMIAAFYGLEPGSAGSYLASLGLALVGAAMFSVTSNRHRHERVPQEAIIGIVYAVASAAVILLASKLNHGAQEIERMLVGSILWVTWPTILKTAVIYGVVGLFHWLLRDAFLDVSTDPKGAYARGRRVRLLDFAFYASFAIVITSSVGIAGVLLVFTFLVVPAVTGVLLADGLRARLGIAWATSVAASSAGLAASWLWDLPTGAAIVATFGGVLVAVTGLRRLVQSGA